MTTFKELYGCDPTPHMLADKGYKEDLTPLAAPDLVVGLELEIESWEGVTKYRGFEFKEDNSLRGSSIEAVTKPTKSRYVEDLLTGFFTFNGITENNYSERCGTHVHMNVSNMTEDQLAAFCLLYQVFERSLFKYVGDDRDNNIFCVPWEQAGISYDLLHAIRTRSKDLSRTWRKYTALNLIPIYTFGSVEFRHLPGTCDVKYLMGWINLIGCMYNYAMSNSYAGIQQEVIDLNTSSAYNTFITNVFGQFLGLLDITNLQQDMEVGVINVKLMSITDMKPKKEVTKKSAVPLPGAYVTDDYLDGLFERIEVAARVEEGRQAPPVRDATGIQFAERAIPPAGQRPAPRRTAAEQHAWLNALANRPRF